MAVSLQTSLLEAPLSGCAFGGVVHGEPASCLLVVHVMYMASKSGENTMLCCLLPKEQCMR